MAQNEGQEGKPTGEPDERKRDVAEFLQAPRKKRKSYVLVASGAGVPQDLEASIANFVKTNYKGTAVSYPRSVEELLKQLNRQIVLLIYDDEFTELEAGLQMLAEMKKNKVATPIPVLFLTRQPEQLIESYSRILLPFHEIDDYLAYARLTTAHVLNKIRNSLAVKNKRRSRRYKVDQPIRYFLLSQNQMVGGQLLDLSVHGAMIRAENDLIFRAGDQLKMHVPVAEYLPLNEGDYLKISARVRRVLISGSQAGVSFEHVTDKQLSTLTRYLTELVNAQNQRRATAMRALKGTRP